MVGLRRVVVGDRVARLTKRQRLALAGLGAIAIGFIALDATGSSLGDAHGGARGVLGSLYRGSDSVLGPARRYLQALPGAGHDAARINTLEDENAALRSQLAANAADADTSAQLAKLRLAAGMSGLTIVAAKVIAYGPGQGFDWTVVIDAGTSSGVALDQTVTSASGLVGRIVAADASTSVVLLAVDPQSGVGVRDQRSGELALATGIGTGGYTLTPLSPSADLRVGDELETGPVGTSTYAPGLTLGTITKVQTNSSGSVTASVRAAIRPTTLDLVGVVTAQPSATARPPLTPTTSSTGGSR